MPSDDPRDHDRALQADQSGPVAANEPAGRFAPVAEAAGILGITTDAVRGRIKRETIRSERRGGAVYVWITAPEDAEREPDQPPTDHDTSRPADDQPRDQSELVEVLREQAEYLRDQLQQERDANRENRRIIAGLTQRIPQLEAPASDTPQDVPQEAGRGAAGSGEGYAPPESEKPAERRSETRLAWWRRLLGLEEKQ